MAPQVWIAVALMSIMLVVKLALIIYSRWYEQNEYVFGYVGAELQVLAVAIMINLFALYGLNCSIKGGCVVYAWIIVGILVLMLITTMFSEITVYKLWRTNAELCTKAGGKVKFTDNPNEWCVLP
jgi:hypothetical protein